MIDPGEQSDGRDLNGATCESQEFQSGPLACTDQCIFDESDCVPISDGPTTSEFLLFDESDRQFTASDRGFHVLISPGDSLPVDNWSSPIDYYQGEFHIRYIITGPPDQVGGRLQTCIWTMGDGHHYFPESCSGQSPHSGVGETFNNDLTPANWWKKYNVPVDYAHPERFLIRVVLRGPNGCNVTNYDVDNACWGLWEDYEDMIFRVTIVMVGSDDTFSGWENYP